MCLATALFVTTSFQKRHTQSHPYLLVFLFSHFLLNGHVFWMLIICQLYILHVSASRRSPWLSILFIRSFIIKKNLNFITFKIFMINLSILSFTNYDFCDKLKKIFFVIIKNVLQISFESLTFLALHLLSKPSGFYFCMWCEIWAFFSMSSTTHFNMLHT